MKVTALKKMIGRTIRKGWSAETGRTAGTGSDSLDSCSVHCSTEPSVGVHCRTDRRAQHTTKICKLACLTLLFSWILGVECTSVSLNRSFWLVDFEWRKYFCWRTCTLYICTMNKILFYPAAPPASNIHPSPPDSNTSFFSTQITFSTPPASCSPQ